MKTLITAVMFVVFGSQASAWVSKQFKPNKASSITVEIHDGALEGCWTNIGEVKRYAEDKLELAGFRVSRDKLVRGSIGRKDFIHRILIYSSRGGMGGCYGHMVQHLYTPVMSNGVVGLFMAGATDDSFSELRNVNQLALEKVGNFMKEVDDPQW